MAGIRSRFKREKELQRIELEEAVKDFNDSKVFRLEDELDEYEEWYLEDVKDGLFDDYKIIEEYEEDDYDDDFGG